MSSSAPARSPAVAVAVGVSLLLAAATGGVLATCSLPFTDLPQHATTMAILRDPAAYGEAYRIQLSLLDTNSLWFVLDRALWSRLSLSPRDSLALGSWLAVVLLPLAMALWSRALRGEAAVGALLGWAAAWSMPLFRGYLHYALGLPVGLLALAVAAPGLRGWRGPVLALLLVLLFLLHAQVLAFVVGALVLQALLTERRHLLALAGWALPAGALLARWAARNLLHPVEGTAHLGSLQGGLGAKFDPPGWALGHLSEAAQGVLMGPGWDDGLAWGLVLIGLGGGIVAARRGERAAWVSLGGALAALLLYLCMPLHIEGQFFISTRMAPWVALLALPMATQPLPAPWQTRRLMVCALLAVGVSAGMLYSIVRFSAEAAPLDALLARIPAGQRVMLWAPSRHSAVVNTKPYTHHPAWYVAASPGASMTFSFAEFRPNPVVYRDPDATPRSRSGEEFQAWCTAFAGDAGDVDYVIAREDRPPRAMCGALAVYAAHLEVAGREGDWGLYRVTTPLPGQTGVDCTCPVRP